MSFVSTPGDEEIMTAQKQINVLIFLWPDLETSLAHP